MELKISLILSSLCTAAGLLSFSPQAVAQQVGGTPAWSNSSNTYQYSNTWNNVGSFPTSSRFAYGDAPNIENSTVTIDAPPSSVAEGSFAIAGYSRCAGGGNALRMTNCVGLFGVGLLNANSLGPNSRSGGAWGINALAVNAPAAQAGPNTGYDFGFLGHELDVNVIAKAGGTAPQGSAIGLYINGNSAIKPTSNFTGIQVSAGGVAWKQGLWITPKSYDETGIVISRATDTNPNSFFVRGTNAANDTTVFNIDDRGDIQTYGQINLIDHGDHRTSLSINGTTGNLDALTIHRFTDTNPSGVFIVGTNAANTANPFVLTDRGDIITSGSISMNGTITNGNITMVGNGNITTTGAINAALFSSGANAGVNCSGPPTANFQVTAGIVTRC